MRKARTRIDMARRQQLIEAAYQTFLEHGINGMTMARIGERAGMSHGIVNYYFKTKTELLSAVIRKANALILQETSGRLRGLDDPRARISAVINAFFASHFFTREVARAWVSYYASIALVAEFERMQAMMDRRLTSNLCHALRQLIPPERVKPAAFCIHMMIDGTWLHHARTSEKLDGHSVVSNIEDYVDMLVAQRA
ncbi:transcriptional regulator BetI [Aestuariivirga sp.]|uniref:transcriptional regulator BetI n=1 Tax=Aestuariivirga sp. TaxID=2650926 RepID=UPI0039E5B75E